MSHVPDLVPDSDTGVAKDMVTKTIDRLTADTVATGTHHTKLAPNSIISTSYNLEHFLINY